MNRKTKLTLSAVQGSGSKDVTSIDELFTFRVIPGEFHLAFQEAKHAVSGLSRSKDHRSRFKIHDLARASEGSHGVQGIHGRQSGGRALRL
jgi:divalent metal cation (Fe/Co/Zn/Cd) transporter